MVDPPARAAARCCSRSTGRRPRCAPRLAASMIPGPPPVMTAKPRLSELAPDRAGGVVMGSSARARAPSRRRETAGPISASASNPSTNSPRIRSAPGVAVEELRRRPLQQLLVVRLPPAAPLDDPPLPHPFGLVSGHGRHRMSRREAGAVSRGLRGFADPIAGPILHPEPNVAREPSPNHPPAPTPILGTGQRRDSLAPGHREPNSVVDHEAGRVTIAGGLTRGRRTSSRCVLHR